MGWNLSVEPEDRPPQSGNLALQRRSVLLVKIYKHAPHHHMIMTLTQHLERRNESKESVGINHGTKLKKAPKEEDADKKREITY